jgi:SAM-dependent methyltransferase
LRYRHFRERGSGIGSRGDNLLLKRKLLREQGVEAASSVLDVGCGDLEVIKDLAIVNYLGIDQSCETLEIAKLARPDWRFKLAPAADVPAAEMVICFEVLIHQETEEAYRALIDFLAQKTIGTLLVSGYAADHDFIQKNPMLFFYEPLQRSLRRTGRFRTIRPIRAHANVAVFRCDV